MVFDFLGAIYAVGGYLSFAPNSSLTYANNSAVFGNSIASLPSSFHLIDPTK
jgi:hypothetical protein